MELSDIYTRNDLADLLGIKRGKLTHILYIQRVDTMYSTFSIPKKNGDERTINAPNDDLKQIQRKLAKVLWEHQVKIWEDNNIQSNVSHAFQKRKSIITNSLRHKRKRYIVNIDLENFFDSFNFGRVRGFFIKNSFWNLTEEVATVIAQLTCYKGTLPQGAPTSPVLTNMICNIMDMHLLTIAKRYRLTYTRYADDMTFSTNDKHFIEEYDSFYTNLSKEITKSGFQINQNKTRILFHDNRQEVTGLIVNSKININREYCKATHAMAHSLYINNEFKINGSTGTINQLEGRFAFIDQIQKFNNLHDNKSHTINNLSHREKKYQQFLFYKNFCINSKPLIITEGKTDILYLKSALRNLYIHYPHLIEKRDDEWIYKISFLHRSNKLSYFFNLNPDGADTMTNIYNMYKGTGKMHINYYEYFHEKYNVEMQQPVILLYDNEFAKDKPIKKFITTCGCNEENLKKTLYTRLIGNLYVQVVPLAHSKALCEIEDLFNDELLNLEISGRKFDRTGKKDIAKFYNKDIFSKYVITHFETIDFSEFKPLLDTFERVITDYSSIKDEM